MITAEATKTTRRFTKSRDKYGRTVRHIEQLGFDGEGKCIERRTIGVIVNLPKGAQTEDRKYFVNDWRIPGVEQGVAIHDFASLKGAYEYWGVGRVEFQQY